MSNPGAVSEYATPFEAAGQILAKCRKYRHADVADVEALAGLVSELALSEAADAKETELLAAIDRAEKAESELKQLTTEYGIDATFASTRSVTFTVADTLGDALKALDQFDAERGDVVCRQLVERPVGEWRKVGDVR